jgi:hypothetical protein
VGLRAIRPSAYIAAVTATAVVAAGLAGGCGGEPGPGEVVAAPGPDAPPATAASGAGSAAPPWFAESARERGIGFEHRSGADGQWFLPEIMCGGAALFDMDGDGDLDAFLVQSDGVTKAPAERAGSRLYRNLGGGRFEDATAGSGADGAAGTGAGGANGTGANVRLYGMGAACGDADGDGDTDLFVTGADGFALLLNDGSGRFRDATDAAGVRASDWASSAAFLDVDADGDLDLYVACYIRWSPGAERPCDAPQGGRDYCSPRSYAAPAPDRLFLNEGMKDGTPRFRDVSEERGLRKAYGNGLGVVAGDFDGDGRQDVFVANDGVENQLWIQRPDGTFEDEALVRGCAMDRDGTRKAGMGVAAMDIEGDDDLDLLVVNLVDEGDSVFRNEGRHFVDRTTATGLAAPSRATTRFGVGLADFDLDGRLDVYVAAGRVTQGLKTGSGTERDPFAQPNQLLRGTPEGRFAELQPAGGTAVPLVATSRAAAFGDIDDDGDIDVLVANRDAPPHLLVNVAPRRGNWAMLRVVGRSGADEIGARVTAAVGGRRVFRDVRAAYSYCASNDPRVHLGLGEATRLEDVRVRWVDGTVEAFGDLPASALHTLRRGAGKPSEWVRK